MCSCLIVSLCGCSISPFSLAVKRPGMPLLFDENGVDEPFPLPAAERKLREGCRCLEPAASKDQPLPPVKPRGRNREAGKRRSLKRGVCEALAMARVNVARKGLMPCVRALGFVRHFPFFHVHCLKGDLCWYGAEVPLRSGKCMPVCCSVVGFRQVHRLNSAKACLIQLLYVRLQPVKGNSSWKHMHSKLP